MKSQLIMKELLLDDDERLQVGNNYNLGGENEEEEHKMNEEWKDYITLIIIAQYWELRLVGNNKLIKCKGQEAPLMASNRISSSKVRKDDSHYDRGIIIEKVLFHIE